ncbi:MAG: 50S ribosomal protein L10 [Mycoplasma sp.]|nr:50S ribosomal protein L10 [Mycoplasma sp.]
MSTIRKAKEKQVKIISDKLKKSKSIVVAEYHGLTVAQLQELRLQLQEKDVELTVYKNRIFKIATKENGFEDINAELTGPNIYAFGMSDDISPAKILANFAKKNKALKLKAGTYEGKVIGLEELQLVASLPSMEEALGMLANSLLAPIKQIGISLNLLKEEGHLSDSK